MTDLTDIRWRQRLDNYRKAYHKLVVAVDKLGCMPNSDEDMCELVREGLITTTMSLLPTTYSIQ